MPPVAVAVAPYYEASHGLAAQPVAWAANFYRRCGRSGRFQQPPADWHRQTNYGRRMANRYQYTVVELREGIIGGKMSGDKLEQVLNEHAAQGWQLKAITSVEVRGRVGPGGVEGLLVTFERPVG